MIKIKDERKNYDYWLEEISDTCYRIYKKLNDNDFLLIHDNFLPNISYPVYSWGELKNNIKPIKKIPESDSHVKRKVKFDGVCNLMQDFDKSEPILNVQILLSEKLDLINYAGMFIRIYMQNNSEIFRICSKDNNYVLYSHVRKEYYPIEDVENLIINLSRRSYEFYFNNRHQSIGYNFKQTFDIIFEEEDLTFTLT